MTTPLFLKGNLKLGTSSGSSVEVGDEVTHFAIGVKVDEIEVPETMGTAKGARAGAADYSVTLGYLSSPQLGGVFRRLFDGIISDSGTMYFEGTLRDAAVSAANPKWSGTFVVTEASIGGDAEALSTAQSTFPMTGAPTKATS